MSWQKLGFIFCPNNNSDWMYSHASNPVAQHLTDDLFRIYFSTRDKNNASSVGFLDIDINQPQHVLNLSSDPILSPGVLGYFDNDGISIACITNHNNKHYLYYLGWNLCKTVPWSNSIGLAIGDSLTSFQKYSPAPIMGRDAIDPICTSYPWVMYDDNKWKMWYGTYLKWGDSGEKNDLLHVFKYAESTDGIHWIKNNIISLSYDATKGEYAVVRPCVIKEDHLYKMWYCYKGNQYRIGYAESFNGIEWERKDSEVGITVSNSGWDSDSISYPCVFSHKGKKFMLYNGNGYGKTGFGLAVWND